MMKRVLVYISIFFILMGVGTGIFIHALIKDLPDYSYLEHYETPLSTQLFSADGKLFKEYATEKRIFIAFEDIPPRVINTFLAAEDKNFYSHPGLEFSSIVRAFLLNIRHYFKGNYSPMGGSTITQQVAKNFLLSHEKTLTRKIKEAILAFKIEKKYSKKKILELYLNEIYLGSGVYGIASASRYYFNKSLEALTPAEIAYLAALPKAPNAYNIEKNMLNALRRRNWVIHRMQEEGILTPGEATAAQATPLQLHKQKNIATNIVQADYFSEFIRQNIVKELGENALYKGGLTIRTTLDSVLQNAAHQALRKGLTLYDRRFGWRGPVGKINLTDWQNNLKKFPPPRDLRPYTLAVVLEVNEKNIQIGFKNGTKGIILLPDMIWARRQLIDSKTHYPFLGPPLTNCAQVVKPGDVIAVFQKKGGGLYYTLEQIPAVNGAIIVMNPQTGRILALEGGYSFDKSQFNRALQAWRQPGSAFKPFVYLAALEKGFTPDTPVLDAEVEIETGPHQKIWKPVNITNKTYGHLPLSQALARSMNLATIWIAQQIGLTSIEDVAVRFGIVKKLPSGFASVLGTGETNLLKLTSAYATLMAYGKKTLPMWIDRIQDRRGQTIYRPSHLQCTNCSLGDYKGLPPTLLSDTSPLSSPKYIYEIIRMLQKSVEGGAAHNAAVPGHTVIGKTGTSNDYFDAWFVGGTPQLTVGILVGFDTPKSLGKWQTGSAVAAPIFANFYKSIAHLYPSSPFMPPSGVDTEWVDQIITPLQTLSTDGSQKVLLESIPIEEQPSASNLP